MTPVSESQNARSVNADGEDPVSSTSLSSPSQEMKRAAHPPDTEALWFMGEQSSGQSWSADLTWGYHVLLFLFYLIGPWILPARFLPLWYAIALGNLVHWFTNHGTCILRSVEDAERDMQPFFDIHRLADFDYRFLYMVVPGLTPRDFSHHDAKYYSSFGDRFFGKDPLFEGQRSTVFEKLHSFFFYFGFLVAAVRLFFFLPSQTSASPLSFPTI
mmetsp:Transcript_39898/g.102791  ORF Transcript_39898/g.102791 Transcript_39898/m.102791 type:complete len:215 (-) Transcript_39898:439-1083(-)